MGADFRPRIPAAELPAPRLKVFIFRVYVRLFLAIALFVAFEWFLLTSMLPPSVFESGWLILLTVLGFVPLMLLLADLTYRPYSSSFSAASGMLLALLAQGAVLAAPLYVAEIRFPGLRAEAAWYTLASIPLLAPIAYRCSLPGDRLHAKWILRWWGAVVLFGILAGVTTGFRPATWFALGVAGSAGSVFLYLTRLMLEMTSEGEEMRAANGLFCGVILVFSWFMAFMDRDEMYEERDESG